MREISRAVLILLVILALSVSPVVAQGIDAPMPPSALESKNLTTLEFEEAPLSSVMKVLSEQSGINFVASEKVKDRVVTLSLQKVTIKEALETILRATALTYEQVGANIFLIIESGAPEVLLQTKVIPLSYAYGMTTKEKRDEGDVTVEGLEEVVKGLLTEHGSLVVDGRTNSLIITDLPSQLAVIEKVIKEIDTKPQQVMIETEILETKASLLKDLGFEWGYGSSGKMFALMGAAKQQFWPFFNAGKTATDRTWLTRTAPTMTPTLSSGVADFNYLQVVLEALQQDSKTKVLGRPKILTLNNRSGEISIKEDTAIASVTSVSAGAGGLTTGATSQAERQETGIKLKVTPQVNKEGFITLTIEPSVTTVARSTYFTGTGGTSLFLDPQTRSAKTTVMVKDGDTVVIGGLISTDSTDTIKKVPVLGDFPIFGMLFRDKEVTKVDRELIVFLTPHVVKEEMAAAPESATALQWEPAPPVSPPAEKPRAKEAVSPRKTVLEREQEAITRDEVIERTIEGLE